MRATTVSAGDLYPSAHEMFQRRRRPGIRLAALAWLLAAAMAAVVLRRILSWIDRNV